MEDDECYVLLIPSTQLIDTVNGLEYLHQNDIVHGDLKGVS